MTREMRRRVLVTLALIAVAQLLRVVPVPGIDLSTLRRLSPAGTLLGAELRFGLRLSVGAVGLVPYLAASSLVTLLFLVLRKSQDVPEPPGMLLRRSLLLGLVVALLQGCAYAIYLQSLGASVVAHPGVRFLATTALTMTAGFALTLTMAWLISTRGIGNGVCVLIAVEIVESQARAFLAARTPAGGLPAESILMVAVGVIVWVALAALLLGARRPFSGPVGRIARWLPHGITLRPSGVVIPGISLAQQLLLLPVVAAGLLPPALAPRWIEALMRGGVVHSVLLLVLSLLVIYVLTAWAYDPARISRLCATPSGMSPEHGEGFDEGQYDRQLERVMFPVAVGTSLTVVLLAAFAESNAVRLSAVGIAVIVAVAMDVRQQWRVHARMAGVSGARESEAICGACRAPIDAGAEFCPSCGASLDDDARCRRHADRAAVGRCIVCRAPLCEQCQRTRDGRSVCEEHGDLTFVEGWAVAGGAATVLEAEILKGQLEASGVEAEVLSNTIAPILGAPGLFDVNPLVAPFPHRESGGGALLVLVPPGRWPLAMAAVKERGAA